MRFLTISCFIMFLLSKPVWAIDQGQFTVGVAGMNLSNIYAGASNTTRVLPDLKYSEGGFEIGLKEGVTYQFSQIQDNTTSLSVVPQFKPYDASDSANLVGMNRELTIDVGIKGKVKIHKGGTLGVQLFKELTNKHGGTHIDLAYNRFFMNDTIPFSASIGSKWYSSGLSRYRFGVYANEARASRAAYNPGAALVPYVGLSSYHKLQGNLSLFGGVSSQFLPSNLKNSPIIEKSNKTSIIIGLSYSL